MVCHGQLANDRPGSQHLTEFYLWLSVGGALGGLFNAILAPLLFSSVVEYPLMIVLGCLMRPWKTEDLSRRDFVSPVAILLLLCAILLTLEQFERFVACVPGSLHGFRAHCLLSGRAPREIWARHPCGACRQRTLYSGAWQDIARRAELLRSIASDEGRARNCPLSLARHYATRKAIHRSVPSLRATSYYHRAGPFGSITSALAGQTSPHVAVVGLGAGATASYAVPGQEWTFYEIDPAVVRIARDPRYFSYIGGCSNAAINFVLGDGRLRLKEAPENYYSLIALDAFSSDAIPLHLLTREAVGLYLSKLANGGLLSVSHLESTS